MKLQRNLAFFRENFKKTQEILGNVYKFEKFLGKILKKKIKILKISIKFFKISGKN